MSCDIYLEYNLLSVPACRQAGLRLSGEKNDKMGK